MINDQVKQLFQNKSYTFIATADLSGQPHMAIGEQVIVSGDKVLIFENWFCPETLENISSNPCVSIVVIMPKTGKGFQLLGTVTSSKMRPFSMAMIRHCICMKCLSF
jgi:predicted pyridoxine 5'-phosphate oxidase superfamily flavin-nucleotide-binding protein